MPQLIYGTAWKKERTADLVVQAVTLGFSAIDTACQPRHYREDLVGEALNHLFRQQNVSRENLFIQTKFTPIGGHNPQSIPYDPNAPLKEQVSQSFAMTRKNLGIPYVDSYVLHSPVEPLESLTEIWRAMEDVYNNGGSRQLGISNCYHLPILEYLWSMAKIKPAVVQNRFNSQTDYDRDLRIWCNKKGIRYQSFWTLTANPHILSSYIIGQCAERYEKTREQILFRYLTQKEITPLTGTCNEEHMIEDVEIFEFNLEENELHRIDELIE